MRRSTLAAGSLRRTTLALLLAGELAAAQAGSAWDEIRAAVFPGAPSSLPATSSSHSADRPLDQRAVPSTVEVRSADGRRGAPSPSSPIKNLTPSPPQFELGGKREHRS